MIEKNSELPLYGQIKKELVKELYSGRFKAGDDFYSLSEIAKMFGVSQITARRVIKDMTASSLLKTTRGRKPVVREFVQTGISGKIAILFHSITPDDGLVNYEEMPWASNILSGIQKRLMLENAVWTMLPFTLDTNSINVFESRSTKYDAFICLSPDLANILLTALRNCGKPFVTVNQIKDYELNYVTADYYNGAIEVVSHAFSRGYSNYLYLATPGMTADNKLRGFMDGLFINNIDPAKLHIRQCDSTKDEDAKHVFKKFITDNSDALFPLAVYGFGDKMLFGVAEACRELGINIPGQVGIAGSTGIPEAATFSPQLTVSETPMEKIGETAVGMLGKMLKNRINSLPGIKFQTTFVDRGSI